jgi:hypothetical protein
MTYGQTLGLTHNPAVVGNADAYWWGILGVFIKGGVWIGLAGAFLGMGLSGKRYRALEMLIIMIGVIVLMFIGIRWLNRPFDITAQRLPSIYFSADWYWEPNNPKVDPRPECWGGLLCALLGLVAYTGLFKGDRLARNMAFSGFLAGGCGFAIGQSIQAHNAWNPGWLEGTQFAGIPINWWNMMETTFGLVLGFGLALGLWLNHRLIARNDKDVPATIPAPIEWLMITVHAMALALITFDIFVGFENAVLRVWDEDTYRRFSRIADTGVHLGLIPLIGIVGGRYWPYMLPLPLLALPIVGKTVFNASYKGDQLSEPAGWAWLFVLPLLLTFVTAMFYAVRSRFSPPGRSFTRPMLLLAVWLYLSLNFVVFNFPWPWAETTNRTPNSNIFAVCAWTLTTAALAYDTSRRARPRPNDSAFEVITTGPSHDR